MKGTKRYRNGAWRLQVYAGRDPLTGARQHETETVRAPDTKAGAKIADARLRKLVDKVEARSTEVRLDLTVAELLERWFTLKAPTWSPSNAKDYRGIIDGRLVPRIGARQVDQLRTIEVDALYAELRREGGRDGKPLKGATVKKAHVVLHAALEQAVRWGLIAVNPAHYADKPEVEPTTITPPTPDEVGRALAALKADPPDGDPLFHLYVRLAATTGARRGTLLALRWSDIDLDEGTIRFARSISDGGAEFGGLVERPGSKSGRIHKVSVGPATIELLKAQRKVQRETALAAGIPADGIIFGTGTGLPWHPGSVTRKWAKVRATAGLEHVELKSMRHYVATRMLADGDDVRTVAGRLGHANPSVTLQVYAAFLPEKDRAAADRLDDLLDGGTATGTDGAIPLRPDGLEPPS